MIKELENFLSTIQYEDNISNTAHLENGMEINQISLKSHHRQVKLLRNKHKRLLDFLRLIYDCLYEGET